MKDDPQVRKKEPVPLSGFGQPAEELSEAVLNEGGLTGHTIHSFIHSASGP